MENATAAGNSNQLTKNVSFVIDNAMTQMQEQRIKNIAVYNRQQDIKNQKRYLKKHYKEVYNRQQIAYNDQSHILYMQKNITAKYAILSFCWSW